MRASTHLATSFIVAHALIAVAVAQKHPHSDDKGTLQWQTTFAAAKELLRAAHSHLTAQNPTPTPTTT